MIFALGLWRLIRDRSHPAASLVVIGLAVYLLAPLWAQEGGAPHFQRNLALAPYVAALLGAGVVEAIRLVRTWNRPAAALVAGAMAIGFVLTAAYGSIAFAQRPDSDLYEAFDYHSVQLAEAGARPNTAVIVNAYDAQVIQFLDPDTPVLQPGSAAPNGMSIAAFKLADLPPSAQADATVYARDPQGRAAVWLSSP